MLNHIFKSQTTNCQSTDLDKQKQNAYYLGRKKKEKEKEKHQSKYKINHTFSSGAKLAAEPADGTSYDSRIGTAIEDTSVRYIFKLTMKNHQLNENLK